MQFAVSISGFGGNGALPITLLCFFDETTKVLVVGQAIAFAEERIPEFAVVTNVDLPDRDFLFIPEDHVRTAVRDYYARMGQGLIHIEEALNRFRPDNKIESDGVDERGPKYKLSPDIGNGEIAVLAAIAFCTVQAPIATAIDAMSEFTTMYNAIEI